MDLGRILGQQHEIGRDLRGIWWAAARETQPQRKMSAARFGRR
jgi:hypothetical protein